MAEIIGINGNKCSANTNTPVKLEVPTYEITMSDGDLVTHEGFLSMGDGFLAVTDEKGWPQHIYSKELWEEVHIVDQTEEDSD